MSETRKLAAILVSDVVGYSRLAGADEDRILARLRALRSDLIDPTIAVHHGRVVKRTGDGSIIEFRSVVDAVNCAIEVQRAMIERNAGVTPDKRIEFRIGIHLGDVVEEADGDLMGEVAEQCLAHTVGSAVVQAYQRSSMLERRRPVMDAWADFVTGKASAKVVPIKARARASHRRA